LTAALPRWLQPLSHGVFAVDTGFHRDNFDAAYLVVHEGRAAFIDTGTNFALPRLLGALDALGLARTAVDWIIPTHVHLDHAGGVGTLARELTGARVLVHPRGARHLIDPSTLYQGALAVYGQSEMDRSYGQLVAVPADRVDTTADGQTVHLAGRPLLLIDTPGHARHHHCVWDATSRGWFTGDTFGLSYREFDTVQGPWILPTSTPVQFEPEVLLQSIDRLLALQPDWIYLTHYGRVGEVQRLGALLKAQIGQMVDIGRRLQSAPARHDALKAALLDLYAARADEHGCTFTRAELAELLAIDIELNAQGMAVWLDKAAKPAT
jgi:glyoxylase-like metal-dependent hydrolase (beta-lactamase superfamily II)